MFRLYIVCPDKCFVATVDALDFLSKKHVDVDHDLEETSRSNQENTRKQQLANSRKSRALSLRNMLLLDTFSAEML